MCRIFGSFGVDVPQDELRRVSERQYQGGPDAQSLCTGENWSLGANRLAVVDPSGGGQPYRLSPGIVAVFNGEIYNDGHLRALLDKRGYHVPSRCDGAVIPPLYAEFGLHFADLLEGMFAIALIDTRSTPTLLLATDPCGMKPLYYSQLENRGEFYFASELPALLEFDGVDRSIDDIALDSYLTTKTPFEQRTFYQSAQVLQPGTVATVTRAGMRIRERREPESTPAAPGTLSSYGGELRALLDIEVDRLLQADVPSCVITSGGLDSSLITALASRRRAHVASFTIGYTGAWPGDERGYATEVSQWCGTMHHEIELDPASIPELLPDVVSHLGQPNADPITLSTYALFRGIRQAGFTVALTGDAADELFTGYNRLVTALLAPPDGDWIVPYVRDLAAIPNPLRESLYTDDYRALLAETPSVETQLFDRLRSAADNRRTALEEIETRLRLPAYHLRRVDHLSMAWSVEARLPFCQPSIVRCARALPQWAKASSEGRKRAVYAAARDLVPNSVLARPKQPFTLPITTMFTAGTELMAFARELLSAASLRTEGKLAPREVGRLLTDQAEHPSASRALALWSLLVYMLWSRQHAERAVSHGQGVLA